MKVLKKLAATMPVLAAIAIFATVMSCSSSDGNPYVAPEGRPDGENQAGMPTIAGISIISSGNFVGFGEHFSPNLRTYNLEYETPINGETVNMEAYKTAVKVHLFTESPNVLSLTKPIIADDVSDVNTLDITFSDPELKLSTKVYCYNPTDITKVGIYTVNNHGLPTYTVTFDLRGGEWSDVAGSKKAVVKHGYTVAECVANYDTYFRPQGKTSENPAAYYYEFVGWSLTTGWSPDALWNYNKQVSGNITVYAAWEENHHQSLIPDVSPQGSALPTNTYLTITAADADRFYYTTDGTTPDVYSTCVIASGSSAQIDTSFIPDSGHGVLKIISSRDLYNESNVRIETYTKAKLALIGAATENATTFPYTPSGFTVTPSGGGTVYYSTTSGGTDYSSQNKPQFAAAAEIGGTYTLKAIARGAGYLDSEPSEQVIIGGYTVEFDGQGATTAANPSSISNILPGDTIILPVSPTKTGYGFGGWWTAPNGGGTEFTSGTPVNGSYTVYANWMLGLKLTFNTAITKIPLYSYSNPYLAAGETQYSLDSVTWTNITSKTQTIPSTKVVYLRGNFGKNASNGAMYDGVQGLFEDMTTLIKAEGDIRLIDTAIGGTFSASIPPTIRMRYYHMFGGCTNLTVAPALPATTLAEECYTGMFRYCSNLTTAPALPATALTNYCYYSMFQYCTSLTTAPALPATTLATNCYERMFAGCESLTTAPALPATTLVTSCYSYMFQYCTSLATAPATLPATTLAANCYDNMFGACESLTTAPALPATTLVTSCYNQMFFGCRSLNSITVNFTNWAPTNATNWWVGYVSSTGTFYKPSALADTKGDSNIPSGWTVVNQ